MLEKQDVDMRPRLLEKTDQAAVSNAYVTFPAAADNGSPDADATFHVDKFRQSCKPIALKSCLRDAVMSLASSRSCKPVHRDLSVIRRDAVASGFAGTRRAKMNFFCIQQIFLKHRVSVFYVA